VSGKGSKGQEIKIIANEEVFCGRPSQVIREINKWAIENNWWTRKPFVKIEIHNKNNMHIVKKGTADKIMNFLNEFAIKNWWLSLWQIFSFFFLTDFPQGKSITETRQNIMEAVNFFLLMDLNTIPKNDVEKNKMLTHLFNKIENEKRQYHGI